MPRYCVLTPEITSGDCGYGPPEYYHDYCVVWRETRSKAKAAAVRKFRDMNSKYISYCDNPFTGLQIWLHECQHLVSEGDEVCEACQEEFDTEFDAFIDSKPYDGVW